MWFVWPSNRSQFSKQHMDYIIAALTQLYKDRDTVPNLKITFGHTLPMRHFHAWAEPYAPSKEEMCGRKVNNNWKIKERKAADYISDTP